MYCLQAYFAGARWIVPPFDSLKYRATYFRWPCLSRLSCKACLATESFPEHEVRIGLLLNQLALSGLPTISVNSVTGRVSTNSAYTEFIRSMVSSRAVVDRDQYRLASHQRLFRQFV